MTILYALIARGSAILCDHANVSGNFAAVAPLILAKLDFTKNERHSYKYSNYVFNYLIENELVFMCMTDEDSKGTSSRQHFAFLADIQTRFRKQYTPAEAFVWPPRAVERARRTR